MHSTLRLGLASILFALAISVAAAAPTEPGIKGPLSLGELIGLPVIGAENAPLGDVEDILIGFDGRITDFIVNLTGEKREGERVRLPWAGAELERDPPQVKLANPDKPFTPYPGPPHGTLGGIKSALHSYLIGAPAKTALGEQIGEVMALGAFADGEIVDVTLARDGSQMPLPWSFIEIRAEQVTYPTEREIEPVVVVIRPE